MVYYMKKKKVSSFGLIFSMIIGAMIQVLFYNAFEINMELLPSSFVLTLWVVFSATTYSVFKWIEI